MSTLLEKPALITFLGVMIAVVLGFVWVQLRRRAALYACVAVIVLTVAGVVMSRFVVTEREAVEAVLHEAATAVERNDLAALMELIHADAPQIRSQASAELPQYEFQEVNIKSNLKIELDQPEEPTEAVAKFNVVVMGSDRLGLMKGRRVPRYCEVTFRKQEGRWRVYSYTHDDPREGFRQDQ